MVVDISVESFSTLSSMREDKEKLHYDERVVPTRSRILLKAANNQGCKAS